MKEVITQNEAYILIGSNILPHENILRAVRLLKEMTDVHAVSAVWETQAVGSKGPNFLNCAAQISTDYSPDKLKARVITPIENSLSRMRTSDKYAPRTIDLDIVIFNQQIIDHRIWDELFIALPLAELLPGFRNPLTGEDMLTALKRLKINSFHKQRADLVLT